MSESVCIGIDVGGTNYRAALVERNGIVLSRIKDTTEIGAGLDHFLGRLSGSLHMLIQTATATGRNIEAIGIGIPGLIANDGYIYSSVNLLPLQGFNLARSISNATGLPTISLNDANASALGEKQYGAGRPYSSILVLTLGTGVGSGLILDNRLWTGIDGVAAEFGHVTVEPEGLLCACGNHGCLEQYASAGAILNAGRRVQQTGGFMSGINDKELTAKSISDAARAGVSEALVIYGQVGHYLGLAIASVINLLNLEAVVICGGVSDSFDLLEMPIYKEIQKRSFKIPADRIRIIKGTLGDDAGILGAAAMAWQESNSSKS